jgi:hypothetical protein
VNGELHREDGPAVEWADGTRKWYLNGKLHREGGPAFEGADGTRAWWLNDILHREDGPAVEWADGTREWWYRGTKLRVRTLKGLLKALPLLRIQEVMES